MISTFDDRLYVRSCAVKTVSDASSPSVPVRIQSGNDAVDLVGAGMWIVGGKWKSVCRVV